MSARTALAFFVLGLSLASTVLGQTKLFDDSGKGSKPPERDRDRTVVEHVAPLAGAAAVMALVPPAVLAPEGGWTPENVRRANDVLKARANGRRATFTVRVNHGPTPVTDPRGRRQVVAAGYRAGGLPIWHYLYFGDEQRSALAGVKPGDELTVTGTIDPATIEVRADATALEIDMAGCAVVPPPVGGRGDGPLPVVALADRRPIGTAVRETPQGLELSGDGLVESRAEFAVPIEINAVVRTTGDTRLFFGRGHVILNWADNRDDLRFTDPATGSYVGRTGNGRMPTDRWVKVRWVVDEGQTVVYVDGQERCRVSGPYRGMVGRVGIGGWIGAKVTVGTLTVSPYPPGSGGTDGRPGVAGGTGDAARAFSGRWHGEWKRGGTYEYEFANGRFTSSGGASAAFRVEGGAVGIDLRAAQPGTTNFDRYTPAGADRLLLESWPTADDFRAGKPPSDFGVAVRPSGRKEP